MPKSSYVDAKFLASVWEMIAHANEVGVQCTIVWRLSDEDFTIASTVGSKELSATLVDVAARSVVSSEGHTIKKIGDVASADYRASVIARRQGEKKNGKD